MSSARDYITWTALIIVLLCGCQQSVEPVKLKGDPDSSPPDLRVTSDVSQDAPSESSVSVSCPEDHDCKVLFLIDASPAAQVVDPSGYRGKAVEGVMSRLGKSPNYHFGVILFAGEARNLIQAGFTQNAGSLSAAVLAVQQAPGSCVTGRCRSYRDAISLASSVVSNDIKSLDPEQRSKTSYTIIMLASGPPVPAIDRCACRDKKTETLPENWKDCPWTECDGCTVTCPPQTRCEDTLCYPICEPGCAADEFCDSDFLCKEGQPASTPTLPPLSILPVTVPDTFITWVLPAEHSLDEARMSAINGKDTPGPCRLSCVYYRDSTDTEHGNTSSCEEQLLVDAVRELKNFAEKNAVAASNFHALYLLDKQDYTTKPGDSFAPLCDDPIANQARTKRLLVEMSFAGQGRFLQFAMPETISFDELM